MKSIPTVIKVFILFIAISLGTIALVRSIKPYYSYSASVHLLSSTDNVQFVDELLVYTDNDDTLDAFEVKCLAKLSDHYIILINNSKLE